MKLIRWNAKERVGRYDARLLLDLFVGLYRNCVATLGAQCESTMATPLSTRAKVTGLIHRAAFRADSVRRPFLLLAVRQFVAKIV